MCVNIPTNWMKLNSEQLPEIKTGSRRGETRHR